MSFSGINYKLYYHKGKVRIEFIIDELELDGVKSQLIINGQRVIPDNVYRLIFRSIYYPLLLNYEGMNVIPEGVEEIQLSTYILSNLSKSPYIVNGKHIIPSSVKKYIIGNRFNDLDHKHIIRIINNGVSFINNGATYVSIRTDYFDQSLIFDGIKAFPDSIKTLKFRRKNESIIYVFSPMRQSYCLCSRDISGFDEKT